MPDGDTAGDYRPPCEAVAHMDPTAPRGDFGNYHGGPELERRVCPNCRLFFDVGTSSDKVFCSDACRRRHDRGEYIADGGTNTVEVIH